MNLHEAFVIIIDVGEATRWGLLGNEIVARRWLLVELSVFDEGEPCQSSGGFYDRTVCDLRVDFAFWGRQLDAYQTMGSEHAAACLRVKTVDSM